MNNTFGWFGADWPKEARHNSKLEIETPVGAFCYLCEEAIGPKDSGIRYPDGDYAHCNCHMRNVLGPVAHIEKRCGCYVSGSTEDDPPGMTPRQAADAAVEAWKRKRKILVN